VEGSWNLCGSTGLVGLLQLFENTLNWCLDLGLVGGLWIQVRGFYKGKAKGREQKQPNPASQTKLFSQLKNPHH
jgi:hypothetical protein